MFAPSNHVVLQGKYPTDREPPRIERKLGFGWKAPETLRFRGEWLYVRFDAYPLRIGEHIFQFSHDLPKPDARARARRERPKLVRAPARDLDEELPAKRRDLLFSGASLLTAATLTVALAACGLLNLVSVTALALAWASTHLIWGSRRAQTQRAFEQGGSTP